MSRLFVCPLDELPATLESSGATSMVCLMGPGKALDRPPQISGSYLSLEFNDIAEPRDGLIHPGADHIKQLLDFFATCDRRSPLLIHCWMGISRSTAAALIALAQHDPDQDMQQLAGKLRAASPMATPNPLMIRLADDQLGLDGRLRDAVKQIGRGAEASGGQPFSMAWAS